MRVDEFISINAAALTHRGIVRDRNEDAVLIGGTLLVGDMESPTIVQVKNEMSVLIVADGMGGHARGELASREVLQTLRKRLDLKDALAWRVALRAANDRLYDLMREQPEVLGLGTTIVGVAFYTESLIHFNVGDSRAYRHSRGMLEQISHDDVPVNRRLGLERATHEITQSLGGRLTRTEVRPHVASALPLRPGEAILLCSDGLTDMISEGVVSGVLDDFDDPAQCARSLFDLALKGGGRDNVSIVVARAT